MSTEAKYSFDIQGMSCDHCVRAVKNALEEVDGVKSTKVEIGHAEVEATDDNLHDRLAAAIQEEGYEVRGSSSSSQSSS